MISLLIGLFGCGLIATSIRLEEWGGSIDTDWFYTGVLLLGCSFGLLFIGVP